MPVFLRLLLLLTAVPLIELYLLFTVADAIGSFTTVVLILLTGALGAFLAHRQGLQAWQALQREVITGAAPGATLIDGVLILIAGGLLITPGLLTDAAGFALLVPSFRRWGRARMKRWFHARAMAQFGKMAGGGADRGPSQPEVIDAEFKRHAETGPAPEGEPK